MSTKEINKVLGLGDGGIDEFFSDLNLEEAEGKLNSVDEKIKGDVVEIDNQIRQYGETGLQGIDVTKLESSFSEIKDLIEVSKQTIKHVYDSIVTSELTDPELVQALSKLLEATHLSISEYINMYKSRVDFYDKVRLETLKQQFKLEQMDHKHQLDLEKLNMQNKSNAIEATANTVAYTQEDLVKSIDRLENEDDKL